MTRPGMVRADTLDLQDQDSPSTQDHSKNSPNAGADFSDKLVASHQAAELRHVNQERHNEQVNLQHAWNGSDEDKPGANGSQDDSQDDSNDGDGDGGNDDDMLDRISSSPSIEDEDIDFDFVYALHTFVATVEGQANATKGDTMVLLDDSNSYWWLVRVVKDSSIGYLPAEHIETPTERLARLNKHRNVDLSAAMLGDNAERTKNPLKKAMKRRGAKTVQFAAPTYVDPSDNEYTSDEDEEDDLPAGLQAGNNVAQQQQQQQQQQIATANDNNLRIETAPQSANGTSQVDAGPQSPRVSERSESAASMHKKGPQRSTDSFLKDDTAETRKFTLTPNLLREDTNRGGRPAESNAAHSEATDPFAAAIEAVGKEEKRKKEKKQGMLSGLFKSKKKDKKEDKTKRREYVSEIEVERVSIDAARLSAASLPGDAVAKGREMERKTSQKGRKLQKGQPFDSASELQAEHPNANEMAELEGSQVAHEAPTGLEDELSPGGASHVETPVAGDSTTHESPELEKPRITPAIRPAAETVPISFPAREGLSSREDERDIDSYDGDERSSIAPSDSASNVKPHEPPRQPSRSPPRRPPPLQPDEAEKTEDDVIPITSTTLSSHIPPHFANGTTATPAGLQPISGSGDESSMDREHDEQEDEEQQQRGQESKSSNESLQRATAAFPSPATSTDAAANAAAAAASSTTVAPTWSDAGLRAWLDGDNNDVRDMLAVIYDTSNVQPVGLDHPLMRDLFREEQDALDKMSAELDQLLYGFINTRSNSAGAVQASV